MTLTKFENIYIYKKNIILIFYIAKNYLCI